MKILEYNKDKGILELLIEVPEDLYYLFLILEKGDLAYSWTTRQLKFEGTKGESRKGERVKVYLGIRVEGIEYHKFTKKVRVKGVIIEGPEKIHSKGSYHTFSVGIGSKLRIIKDKISPYHEKILELASSKIKRTLVISIGDDEVALGIIRPQGIELISTWAISPIKDENSKSINEMYLKPLKKVIDKILDYIKREKIEIVILASISLLEKLCKDLMVKFLPKRVKLFFVTVSEGGRAGIYEILRRNDLKYLFKDVRGLYERENIESLLLNIAKGDKKVAVGIKEILIALQAGNVKQIILVDDLLFSDSKNEIIKVLEKVLKMKGDILIIPGDTEHGSKIKKIGGAIARLYYPLELY